MLKSWDRSSTRMDSRPTSAPPSAVGGSARADAIPAAGRLASDRPQGGADGGGPGQPAAVAQAGQASQRGRPVPLPRRPGPQQPPGRFGRQPAGGQPQQGRAERGGPPAGVAGDQG